MKTLGMILYALITASSPLVAQVDQPAPQADVFQRAVDSAHASGRFDLRILIGYIDIAEKDLVVSYQTAYTTASSLMAMGFKRVKPDYANLGLPSGFSCAPDLLSSWEMATADGTPVRVTLFVSAVSSSHKRNSEELKSQQQAQSEAGEAFYKFALSGGGGANGAFYAGHFRYDYGYDSGPARRLPNRDELFDIDWYKANKKAGQLRISSALDAAKTLPNFIGCFACSTFAASSQTIEDAAGRTSSKEPVTEGVFIGTTAPAELVLEPKYMTGTIHAIIQRSGVQTLREGSHDLLQFKGYQSRAPIPLP